MSSNNLSHEIYKLSIDPRLFNLTPNQKEEVRFLIDKIFTLLENSQKSYECFCCGVVVNEVKYRNRTDIICKDCFEKGVKMGFIRI